jgi:hypothetical protein
MSSAGPYIGHALSCVIAFWNATPVPCISNTAMVFAGANGSTVLGCAAGIGRSDGPALAPGVGAGPPWTTASRTSASSSARRPWAIHAGNVAGERQSIDSAMPGVRPIIAWSISR